MRTPTLIQKKIPPPEDQEEVVEEEEDVDDANDDLLLLTHVKSVLYQNGEISYLTRKDFECLLLEVCKDDPSKLSSELVRDVFREAVAIQVQINSSSTNSNRKEEEDEDDSDDMADGITAEEMTRYISRIQPRSCLYRADVVSDRVFLSWSVWSCFVFISASVTSIVANVSDSNQAAAVGILCLLASLLVLITPYLKGLVTKLLGRQTSRHPPGSIQDWYGGNIHRKKRKSSSQQAQRRIMRILSEQLGTIVGICWVMGSFLFVMAAYNNVLYNSDNARYHLNGIGSILYLVGGIGSVLDTYRSCMAYDFDKGRIHLEIWAYILQKMEQRTEKERTQQQTATSATNAAAMMMMMSEESLQRRHRFKTAVTSIITEDSRAFDMELFSDVPNLSDGLTNFVLGSNNTSTRRSNRILEEAAKQQQQQQQQGNNLKDTEEEEDEILETMERATKPKETIPSPSSSSPSSKTYCAELYKGLLKTNVPQVNLDVYLENYYFIDEEHLGYFDDRQYLRDVETEKTFYSIKERNLHVWKRMVVGLDLWVALFYVASGVLFTIGSYTTTGSNSNAVSNMFLAGSTFYILGSTYFVFLSWKKNRSYFDRLESSRLLMRDQVLKEAATAAAAAAHDNKATS